MIASDVVGAVSQAASAVGAGIEADLQRAAAIAGMGGKFEVDLDVLYGYYGRLSQLYTHVEQLITDCADDDSITSATSRITGVAAAKKATVQARSGGTSLKSALRAIQGELGDHLDKLFQSYTTYIKADEDGAQRLTAAAHPELANATATSTGTAAGTAGGTATSGTSGGASASKPLGW